MDKLRYLRTRDAIWRETNQIREDLHLAIRGAYDEKALILQRLTGLALLPVSWFEPPEGVRIRSGAPVFQVHALREARRLREDGRVLNQVFLTILQTETLEHEGRQYKIRCGSTLILDLDEARVTYAIRKGLRDQERMRRTIAFQEMRAETAPLAATYFGEGNEPFAALHRLGA